MRAIVLIAICMVLYFSVGYFIKPVSETNTSASATGTIETLTVSFPNFAEKRLLRILLPDGYDSGDQRYPVLYVQDGQNLFDNATAYSGEWGLDETLLSMQRQGLTKGVIVVGIDHAGKGRMSEYGPWDFTIKKFRYRGLGNAYIDHLATVIKPMIDANYRTKTAANHTGLIGSSMGGLLSLYGGLRHPQVFGKIAALSPTLADDVVGDNIFTYARLKAPLGPQKIYMDMGDQEVVNRADIADNFNQLASQLETDGQGIFTLRREWIDGGTHDEASWGNRIQEIILWLDLE